MQNHRSTMIHLTSEKIIVEALTKMDEGAIEPWQTLQTLKEALTRELQNHNAPLNIRNAAQIASLLASKINPEDTLNKITLHAVAEGRFPAFSNEAPEETSIIRGCAVLLLSIKDMPSDDTLKSSCSKLLQHIDVMGYIPDDFVED